MKNLALWTVSGGLFAAPQTRYMASWMLREDYDDFRRILYCGQVRSSHFCPRGRRSRKPLSHRVS